MVQPGCDVEIYEMNRRDFLTAALAAPLMGKTERSRNFGWLPYAESVLQEPRFRTHKHLTNFGQSKVACLWKAYENVTGTFGSQPKNIDRIFSQ